MRAKLPHLNHCAVPFLSTFNLCWYYYSVFVAPKSNYLSDSEVYVAGNIADDIPNR